MPSYIQLASDNFARADANPLSGNWTTLTGTSNCKLVSGAVQPSTTGSQNYVFYNGIVWPNDQYSEVTISALAFSGSAISAAVRMSASAETAYIFGVHNPAGTPDTNAGIGKFVAGSFIQLATMTITPNLGDVLRLEVLGTTLTAKQNGTIVATVTDSSISSGNAGFGFFLNGGSSTSDVAITPWDGGKILLNSPAQQIGAFLIGL